MYRVGIRGCAPIYCGISVFTNELGTANYPAIIASSCFSRQSMQKRDKELSRLHIEISRKKKGSWKNRKKEKRGEQKSKKETLRIGESNPGLPGTHQLFQWERIMLATTPIRILSNQFLLRLIVDLLDVNLVLYGRKPRCGVLGPGFALEFLRLCVLRRKWWMSLDFQHGRSNAAKYDGSLS